MESWFYYCYEPVVGHSDVQLLSNFTFIFWAGNDFGLCFEKTVLVTTPLALLSIMSSLYNGLRHSAIRRKRPAIVGCIRAAISLFLLLNSLTGLVGSFWLSKERPFSVLLAQAVGIFAWLVHLMCWLKLSWSVLHSGWGPTLLNLSWALTLLGSIVEFRTYIQYKQSPVSYALPGIANDKLAAIYFSTLLQVNVYVEFGLQCLYAFTLPFPVRPATGKNVWLPRKPTTRLTVQEEIEERRPLLNGVVTADTVRVCDLNYEAVTQKQARSPSTGRGSAEDMANPLSLLSFWWLQPLMKKGALGLLQRPEDLPQLPASLSTAKISKRFQQVLHRGEERRTSDQAPTQTHAEDEQEFRSLGGISRSVSSLSQQSGTAGVSSSSSSSSSLFFSLNRAFGWHYYPLGLLKLISDSLGFAGPLLLNSLVSFMENRTVCVEMTGCFTSSFLFPRLFLFPGTHVSWLLLCPGPVWKYLSCCSSDSSFQLSGDVVCV